LERGIFRTGRGKYLYSQKIKKFVLGHEAKKPPGSGRLENDLK